MKYHKDSSNPETTKLYVKESALLNVSVEANPAKLNEPSANGALGHKVFTLRFTSTANELNERNYADELVFSGLSVVELETLIREAQKAIRKTFGKRLAT